MAYKEHPLPLLKQHTWSPDSCREEVWLKRKGMFRKRKSMSVTDEDLEELKACIELGFGFDASPVDPLEAGRRRLEDTLPALSLYYEVNRRYNDAVCGSARITPAPSCCFSSDDCGSPVSIVSPGDSPQTVKTRLKQWAQVVGCSVRQFSRSS